MGARSRPSQAAEGEQCALAPRGRGLPRAALAASLCGISPPPPSSRKLSQKPVLCATAWPWGLTGKSQSVFLIATMSNRHHAVLYTDFAYADRQQLLDRLAVLHVQRYA